MNPAMPGTHRGAMAVELPRSTVNGRLRRSARNTGASEWHVGERHHLKDDEFVVGDDGLEYNFTNDYAPGPILDLSGAHAAMRSAGSVHDVNSG